jgi:hypothetical protein
VNRMPPRNGLVRGGTGRRHFIAGGVCFACQALSYTHLYADAAKNRRRYCFDKSVSVSASDLTALINFPQRALVAYIEREQQLLYGFFSQAPEVFIDAYDNGAYADQDKNYVALGMKFIERYQDRMYGLLLISGIIAHELAHIFQVHWKINAMLEDVGGYKVKYVELHADYLSGSYMAWREKYRAAAPAELAALFYELGDRDYSNPLHHGTQQDRFLAFQHGYHDFRQMVVENAKADIFGAATKGLIYVRQLISRR